MNAAAWLAVLLGWGLLSWLFLGVARLAAHVFKDKRWKYVKSNFYGLLWNGSV